MKYKKKYKVLYVYSGKIKKNSGGIDLVVRQQIEALIEKGFDITLLSRGRFSNPNVKNICFRITPANLISFLPARYYYHAQHRFISFFAGLFLKFNNFDCVIGWQQQCNFLFQVAKKKSINTILNCPVTHVSWEKKSLDQPNFIWPNIPNEYIKKEYHFSDRILVASDFAKLTFIQNDVPDNKVFVIGRGADTKRFSLLNNNSNKFRVVFFGRASERKGIFQALEAWKFASIKNGEFLIIGAIPKEIYDKIHAFIPSNVHILGHLKNPEKILKTCSIQILPTRMEGMAKSLIEGAACGLITLSTKESGFPILEGITGYYIKRDDINNTAKKIKFLYQNPRKLKEMSKNSHDFVVKNLTWNMFRFRFIDAIENFLGRFS